MACKIDMAAFTVAGHGPPAKSALPNSPWSGSRGRLVVDKFCGNGRQIVKNQGAYRQVFSLGLFAFSGFNQNWLIVDGFGRLQVTEAVPDEPYPSQGHLVMFCNNFQHARLGLAAIAAFVRPVGAVDHQPHLAALLAL